MTVALLFLIYEAVTLAAAFILGVYKVVILLVIIIVHLVASIMRG